MKICSNQRFSRRHRVYNLMARRFREKKKIMAAQRFRLIDCQRARTRNNAQMACTHQ